MKSYKKTFNVTKIKTKSIKAILFCIFMLPLTIFFSFLAFDSYLKGSKTLKDFTHVSGTIDNSRYIKHLHNATKYRPSYYEDILVLSIKGCNQQFGFLDNSNNYNEIAKIYYGNNETTAEIYYDNTGKLIEENVTLHISDLKINDKKYIAIEDYQKKYLLESCIFTWISIALILFTYFVIRHQINNQKSNYNKKNGNN